MANPVHSGHLHSESVHFVRSFIAVLRIARNDDMRPESLPIIHNRQGWSRVRSKDGRGELAYLEVTKSDRATPPPASGSRILVLGDEAEWHDTLGRDWMAGAASVSWDPTKGSIRILTSLMGLPTVFCCQRPGAIVFSSDVHLLRSIPETLVEIDPQAATEMFSIGFPIGHRTLFTGVQLMPAGSSFEATTAGDVKEGPTWQPRPTADLDWPARIDAQIQAFNTSLERLDTSNSVLSLTGGLDTRAILSSLIHSGSRLTACTLSGARTRSLDARQASALCAAYGMHHVVIELGDEFLKDLPRYVLEASRLSGGLASIEQAHEVYFNHRLIDYGARRLSGQLGNQVARRGWEQTSTRGASDAILSESLRTAAREQPLGHWLTLVSDHNDGSLRKIAIQVEALFSQAGNYGIGHNFLIQQSPYVCRELIEIALAVPEVDEDSRSFARYRARLRDLRHRLAGEPSSQSFQRRLLQANGGAASTVPINWGWSADGGLSIVGASWGILALADAATTGPQLTSRMGRTLLRLIGADGLHTSRPIRDWLDVPLRDFVNDTLRARAVAGSDLFNGVALRTVLDAYYDGDKSQYRTVVAALDLALATSLCSR